MVKIDDETAWEDNQLDFWFCGCEIKPLSMYFIDGEYRKTLSDFWNSYNRYPLKVIHTLANETDDLKDNEKWNYFQIDIIHSIDELAEMLNDIGWKLGEEKFFITNSTSDIKFEIIEEETLMGKEQSQYPIFDLSIGESLTDTTLHGRAFVLGTNDAALNTKEKVKELIDKVK
ncbi:hypothetical protein [Bacillus sp. 37MA]|uniref:hypothetical protein n=1 Tax=Bacillus sp. 37MA TaxID=1132442 RepID=UPI000377F4BB|nr:hypothetical protein [Bacillus sp. 37MA]